MKRLYLVLLIIPLIFLSSCTKNTPPEIKREFEAVVTVNGVETDLEDFILKAEISVENSTDIEITVISPEEINGLSYIWNDGFEMEYKNLHCKTETDYLPRFSFAQGIYNVLSSLDKSENVAKNESGEWLFTGKSQSGEYELLTDSKGYIRNISVKEINLNADFEY